MVTINNYKDLIKLTVSELNFKQVLEAVYFFHFTNFKTPLFLTSTNKAELKKELISIDYQFRQSNQPPIFVLNGLND